MAACALRCICRSRFSPPSLLCAPRSAPQQIQSFFDPLRSGVRAAAEATLGATVDLDFRTYPRLGEGDVELMEADVGRHFDGIILTPGNPSAIGASLQRLAEQGRAVVCVA